MDELGLDVVSFKFLVSCLMSYGYSPDELCDIIFETEAETFH